MQTSSAALARLNRELTLKQLWENQVKEAEFTAAESVYDLFDPYLDILRDNIKKDNYELQVQAFINERMLGLTGKITVIELNFEWEPVLNNTRSVYHEATFTPTQRRFVRKCLSDFSEAVGYVTEIG